MCYTFLLVFPLDFKEFFYSISTNILPRFYPTGIFGGIVPFIDLKDRFEGGVLQISSYRGDFNRLLGIPMRQGSTARSSRTWEFLPA